MPIFKFSIRPTIASPIGMVGDIEAETAPAALNRLRELLPEYVEVPLPGVLGENEYINVYFYDDQISLADVESIDDEGNTASVETVVDPLLAIGVRMQSTNEPGRANGILRFLGTDNEPIVANYRRIGRTSGGLYISVQDEGVAIAPATGSVDLTAPRDAQPPMLDRLIVIPRESLGQLAATLARLANLSPGA